MPAFVYCITGFAIDTFVSHSVFSDHFIWPLICLSLLELQMTLTAKVVCCNGMQYSGVINAHLV